MDVQGYPIWTPHLVAVRIEQAVDVFKRLPIHKPRGFRSSWPEFIREVEAYRGKYDPMAPTRVKLGPPEATAIDQAIEVAGWMLWLSRRDQRLVWDRATGRSNDYMEAKYKKSRRTLYRWWSKALRRISGRLNEEE